MITRMTIQAWYRIYSENLGSPKGAVPRAVHHQVPFGVKIVGNSLRENDGTLLAEFLRDGAEPLVRQVLPNPLTAKRWRLIREVVLAEDGDTITVPASTLAVAGVRQSTIRVIDSVDSKNPLRAAEQLFTAEVPTWGYRYDSWWGSTRYGQTGTRTAYFLSGHDANERGLSYFLCELPTLEQMPTTVAEAYEALKPQSVKHAEKLRRKVKRQGDMFFIRMPRDWEPPAETERHGIKVTKGGKSYSGNARLHRSNHAAEQVVRIDGLTYVSGTVHHVPDFRRPDHRPLPLGRRHWWLCVRNTVPVVGRG